MTTSICIYCGIGLPDENGRPCIEGQKHAPVPIIAGDEILFISTNHHCDDCGFAPHNFVVQQPNLYRGYYENIHGEQWLFSYNRDNREFEVYGGDCGWSEKLQVVSVNLDEVRKSFMNSKQDKGWTSEAVTSGFYMLLGVPFMSKAVKQHDRCTILLSAEGGPINLEEGEWTWLTNCIRAARAEDAVRNISFQELCERMTSNADDDDDDDFDDDDFDDDEG